MYINIADSIKQKLQPNTLSLRTCSAGLGLRKLQLCALKAGAALPLIQASRAAHVGLYSALAGAADLHHAGVSPAYIGLELAVQKPPGNPHRQQSQCQPEPRSQ